MSRDKPLPGLKELDGFLAALPMNMQKAAYRQALTAAAKPVRDEARNLAPKESGKMAKAIKTGSPRQNPDGTFSISIRLEGEHSFLGLFHEYGVRPHYIAAGDSDLSARKLTQAVRREGSSDVETGALKIGDNFISGQILHPGHAAHPFMRPALDAKADEAVQAFAAKIRSYLEGKTGFAAPLDEAA
ncbi:HK97-gp10 family putative phage morphogenesis protein [Sphingobium sp. CFD-1]|uniref:HK97-gp10 family putative phage morphogenesis protein n=1 Tax=Sphingobium sp. CFD-1 TaxID=2878545 RepID=UPI00214CC90E|nr:HK97-gp10 family putative phage morphogenesis protein [Sphingobium sp. CFD-1]